METVKNAVGLGKESQQGEEPVSGQQGEGTAVKPFDAGNQEENAEQGGKAPQDTDASKTSGDISKALEDTATSSDHDPSNIFVPSMTAPTNIPTAGGVPIGAPVTAARERRESESGTRPTAPANNDHKFAFAASPRTKHNTQTNYHASRAPDLSAGPATYSPAAQERAEQTTNAGVGSSPVRSTPAVHGREGSAGSLSSASQLSESPSRSVSTASAASSAATTSSSLSGADNDGAGKGSRSIRFEALPSRGN